MTGCPECPDERNESTMSETEEDHMFRSDDYDRRLFIQRSLQAGGGLLLISVSPSARGLPILAGTVLQHLGRFVLSVGAGLVANHLYDFLKGLR